MPIYLAIASLQRNPLMLYFVFHHSHQIFRARSSPSLEPIGTGARPSPETREKMVRIVGAAAAQ